MFKKIKDGITKMSKTKETILKDKIKVQTTVLLEIKTELLK